MSDFTQLQARVSGARERRAVLVEKKRMADDAVIAAEEQLLALNLTPENAQSVIDAGEAELREVIADIEAQL